MKRPRYGCIATLQALVLVLGVSVVSHGAMAQATAEAPPKDLVLKGDAMCTRCHDENGSPEVLAIAQTRHGVRADSRTPTCTSCHGESEAHIKNIGGTQAGRAKPDRYFAKNSTTPVEERNRACLTCHESGKRMDWAGSQHESRGVACATCHTVHSPQDRVRDKLTQPDVCFTCHKEQRAQTFRISHHPIREGKVVCSDCHNPHGSTGPKLLVKNSVNETCYTCHAEKRGPFLWEHSPVVDDCTNCHTPHGSTNTPLLKARAPWLCQECHSGDHGAQVNSGANLQNGNATTVNGINPLANAAARAQTTARACLNCHVLIHGSNHPAGTKFQR